MYQLKLLPPANEVCEGYVFTRVCLSTGGTCAWQGGHVWQGCVHVRWQGMHDRGHAWQGACMAGGHAWQGAVHGRRGMHGRGCAWQGGMHAMHIPAADTTRYGNTVN